MSTLRRPTGCSSRRTRCRRANRAGVERCDGNRPAHFEPVRALPAPCNNTHPRIQSCLRSGLRLLPVWLTTEFAQYSNRLCAVCAEERLNVALGEGKFIPGSSSKALRRKPSEQSTAARYLRPASAVALSVAAALVAYLTAQSAVRM